ncbi:tetratricopeptide TPR_2, partial [mine drainage metagenome]
MHLVSDMSAGNDEGQSAESADTSTGKKKVNPEAEGHWLRGNSLFDEGKFDEAVEEYTQAIDVDKEYSSAYFNRALNYAILKKSDLAKKDLQS